ncbi:DUF309 domain-containing protein [Bacillus salitolerans]|uniref:DUF309 domain-containing protein n=1 Tax=Bacillus salitolerans TaxID=1437434 RepID=A0ABW4LUM8_9BACI
MYPQAFIDYLVHFHGDRDYFECHEVLEEFWKEKERGARDQFWVGFIQIAVSFYHHRRGNFPGAQRTLEKAISILEDERVQVHSLGIDDRKLLSTLKERLSDIKARNPYKSLNIPISDHALMQACLKECSLREVIWGSDSDLTNQYLLNKHTLRDRSDVIMERERQKEKKRK